jgi:hypothetical protein
MPDSASLLPPRLLLRILASTSARPPGGSTISPTSKWVSYVLKGPGWPPSTRALSSSPPSPPMRTSALSSPDGVVSRRRM